MARPTRAPAPSCRGAPPGGDGRLDTPVYHRNIGPIRDTLAAWLDGRDGVVLELGSGTGQHVAALRRAFPALVWQASDPDPLHRASCDAWDPGAPPALDLDAAADWPADPAVARLGPLTAVLACNMVHIAPRAAACGLIAGAGRALAPGGLLILYGPFVEDGVHTGPGNAAFDAQLRARNPAWGLRDVADLRAAAGAAGLGFGALTPMPANNRILVFERQVPCANADADAGAARRR
jgi:SAM-dependent methyltransferase